MSSYAAPERGDARNHQATLFALPCRWTRPGLSWRSPGGCDVPPCFGIGAIRKLIAEEIVAASFAAASEPERGRRHGWATKRGIIGQGGIFVARRHLLQRFKPEDNAAWLARKNHRFLG